MHLLLRSSMRLDGRGVGDGRVLRNHTERVDVLHLGSRAIAYLGVTPRSEVVSFQQAGD